MVPPSPNVSSNERDLALVERIQSGDTEAFETMVLEYQPLVTGLLHRFASRKADLEDLVQEAFLRIWKGIPGWKPERPFEHWLKRVTVRTGLDHCRRQKRSPLNRTLDAGTGSDPLDEIPSASAASDEQARQSLEEAQYLLSLLPSDDRALMTLHYLNEMPLAEIADHFGWSLANTKVRSFRARNRFRKLLKDHGYRFE